jgi:hypothetical protein
LGRSLAYISGFSGTKDFDKNRPLFAIVLHRQ